MSASTQMEVVRPRRGVFVNKWEFVPLLILLGAHLVGVAVLTVLVALRHGHATGQVWTWEFGLARDFMRTMFLPITTHARVGTGWSAHWWTWAGADSIDQSGWSWPPLWLIVALVALALLLVLGVWLLLAWLRAGGVWAFGPVVGWLQGTGRMPEDAARWATVADLEPQTVYDEIPGNAILVGELSKRYLTAPPDRSSGAFAPPDAGKTVIHAVPNILAWAGPGLFTSVKPDFYLTVAPALQRRADLFTADPWGMLEGMPAIRWNPITGCGTDFDAAVARGTIMTRVAGSVNAPTKNSANAAAWDFWQTKGGEWLGAAMYMADLMGRPMPEVLTWLGDITGNRMRQALEVFARLHPVPFKLQHAFDTYPTQGQERDTLVQILGYALQAYSFRRVQEFVSETTFEFDDLVRGPNTLGIVMPEGNEGKILAPLTTALTVETLEHWRRTADGRPGGHLEVPALAMIDEAGTGTPIPDIDRMVSTYRARGIHISLLFQAKSQLKETYTENQVDTFMVSTACRILLPGMADGPTLKSFAELVDEEAYLRDIVTSDHQGRRSVQRSVERRPLLNEAKLRAITAPREPRILRSARYLSNSVRFWLGLRLPYERRFGVVIYHTMRFPVRFKALYYRAHPTLRAMTDTDRFPLEPATHVESPSFRRILEGFRARQDRAVKRSLARQKVWRASQ